MIKADEYFKETLKEIIEVGDWDQNPRPRWSDNSPAHSKFVTQKFFKYDISKGEFPVTTLRKIALKGAFYDIEAIYIKQTNILEEMHPSIRPWWKDFTKKYNESKDYNQTAEFFNNKNKKYIQAGILPKHEYKKEEPDIYILGKTYGAIVKRYDLMNKLLKSLEENSFSRRHVVNMFQYQDQKEDPQALVSCAYETLWSVREMPYKTKETFVDEDGEYREIRNKRFIDLTLVQRSMDFLVTASINPAQYTMFGMMVCNHLTFKTGIKHELGIFSHFIQNCHIYNRHIPMAEHLLNVEPIDIQPTIELVCEPKDFYSHTINDFKFNIPKSIKPLPEKLEIAV